MQFCSVTFVPAETILRELRAKVTHDPVTRDLRNHAGGSYAQADAIAIDNCRLRQWEWNHRQTINEDVLRRFEQGFDGQAHRSVARAEDIDPINLNRIDNANRPS